MAGEDPPINDITNLGAGPVSFSHDVGLMKPLYNYLTNEQVHQSL